MLCWGENRHSQLLCLEKEARVWREILDTPQENEFFRKLKITEISATMYSTVVIVDDGSVYVCGGHQERRSKPHLPSLLSSLEVHCVCKVSCGKEHVLVATSHGQLYGWGSNDYGQLGLGTTGGFVSTSKPRHLKSLSKEVCVQLSCGGHHSLSLTHSGRLYAWGKNDCKQLGLGDNTPPSVDTPTVIRSLIAVPIKQISAGGCHAFAISLSGCLYGWGSNSHGQLGLGMIKAYCPTPKVLEALRNLHPKYVCCGGDHTAFLMEDGGVFTCGFGEEGQLGHGNTQSISAPRKVMELMGSTVCQLSCGEFHTAVLEMNKGQVYCFGSNSHGQIGIGKSANLCTTPMLVHSIFSPGKGTPVDRDDRVVRKLVAKGNHTFVILKNQIQSVESVCDYRADPVDSLPLCVSVDRVQDSMAGGDLLKSFDAVMMSPSCVNGSFLVHNYHMMSHEKSCVDLTAGEKAFEAVIHHLGPVKALQQCDRWFSKLLQDIPEYFVDHECLRVYLILTTSPIFNLKLINSNFDLILEPFTRFCQQFISCHLRVRQVVGSWFVSSVNDHFEQMVVVVASILNQALLTTGKHINGQVSMSDKKMLSLYKVLQFGLPFLGLFHLWNKSLNSGRVSHTKFYLPAISQEVDLVLDYKTWRNGSRGTSSEVVFCQYPFTMDASCKGRLLELDSRVSQQLMGHQSIQQNLRQGYLGRPYLDIVVSRSNVLQDAVQQLTELNSFELKKLLKVTFKGEEGDDEGGVRKEFFMLVLKEILNPVYGLFREDDESHLVWFNESLEVLNSPDDHLSYHVVGILCGLAIYNNALIDLPFPSAVYKMLLGSKPDLEDLLELKPSVGRSLQDILSYEGEDMEGDLSLFFEYVSRVFGEVVRTPLVSGGSSVPVTVHNRKSYVEAYVSYVMLDSVKTLYKEFERGFLKLCDSPVLKLFHYQELAALVRGQRVINFSELEEAVHYHNGYHKDHFAIKNFWRVFHQLPVEGKKKFLAFLTGSDRVPVSGFKNMKVIIQRSDPGPSGDRLPVAHTCFNILDLPPYPMEQMMKQKILQAINFTEGFGLL